MRPIALVAALATALLTACSVPAPPATADAMVKILNGSGHGSGFHMGRGFIITAAHVVKDAKSVSLKTSTGETQEVEVLWTNRAYDIALLRAPKPAGMKSSPLACRVPEIGEPITAKGNPQRAEFVTVWGKIAGAEHEFGPWRSVVVTDIATVPGQSGGPVYDTDGNVVGVTVGVMAVRLGFSSSLVGVGYAVPGATVCNLLARGV